MAELGSFCTSCGAKQEPAGAFCTSCGAKRAVPVAVAAPEPPLAPVVVTNVPKAQPEPIAPTVVTPIAVASNTQLNTAPAAPVPSVIALSQQSKGSGSKAIFIVIALVVLFGAAFGGWKYWQKSTRVEIEVSPDATQVPLGGSTHVEAEVPNPNNVDVIWSVKEGSSGGTVTGAGALAERGTVKFLATYNAPNTPGTYHVVATLSDNSESTGETTITVSGAQQ